MTTLLNLAVSLCVGILVAGAVVFGWAVLIGTAPVSIPVIAVVIAAIVVKGNGR